MNTNNKTNIVYYPSNAQLVYVQAVPVQTYNYQPPTNPYLAQANTVVPQIYNNGGNGGNIDSTDLNKIKLQPPKPWQTGLFECCSDIEICIVGMGCPCCLYGNNNHSLKDTGCCCPCLSYLLCCGPLQHCSFRKSMRNKFNLQESPCNDCCVAFCCGPCGICQEAREFKYRQKFNIDQPGNQTMT